MGIFDVFVAVIWGIVEGITEWLPVSSTGHMILVEEFLKFQDEQFSQMFLVVVQLGAILAVVLLFWSRIWPFRFTKRERGESIIDWKIMQMWFKIIVACLPAAIVGILFDDWIDEVFYNAYVVAGALIVYGILFIIVENWNKGRKPAITSVTEIGYDTALIIGIFQLLAAVVRELLVRLLPSLVPCFLVWLVVQQQNLLFIWQFGYVWCKSLKDCKEWIKLWYHGLCDFTRWYVSCLCGVFVCNPIPHELYP